MNLTKLAVSTSLASKLLGGTYDPVQFFVQPFLGAKHNPNDGSIDIKEWINLLTNPQMYSGAGANTLGFAPGKNPSAAAALMHTVKANGLQVLAASVGIKAGAKILQRMGMFRTGNALLKQVGLRKDIKFGSA